LFEKSKEELFFYKKTFTLKLFFRLNQRFDCFEASLCFTNYTLDVKQIFPDVIHPPQTITTFLGMCETC